MTESLLSKYTARATAMEIGPLIHALRDVADTLQLYREADPAEGYAAKLWAEFDAYTVEIQKRRKPK